MPLLSSDHTLIVLISMNFSVTTNSSAGYSAPSFVLWETIAYKYVGMLVGKDEIGAFPKV